MLSAIGISPVNTIIESYENDHGRATIRVVEQSRGMGTRQTGMEMRTLAENMLIERGAPVTIDFDGIGIASSSFVDEFVAKLVQDVGFVTFTASFRLTNIGEVVGGLINQAVAKRLSRSQDRGER